MQGRFKREGKGSPPASQGRGEASADPEPRGGTDRGSSPPRAQVTGQAPADHQSPESAPQAGGAAPAGRPKSKSPSGPGTRLALRNWRISTRLVSLLALPVVAATTLGALRINSSLDNIEQLDRMKLLTEMTQQATQLASALQEERDKSAAPLAGKGNAKDDRVVATREKTDREVAAFNRATQDLDPGDKSLAGVQSTLVDISKQLGNIGQIRDSAYQDDQYYSLTAQDYNELINSLLLLSQDMAQATSNSDMINNTRALATFSSAKEYASIQRALISAALADPKGAEFSANDRRYARTAVDKEEEALRRFNQIRDGNSEDLLEPLDSRADIKSATLYADRAVRDPRGLQAEKRSAIDWYDQDSIKINEMARIEQTLLGEMKQKARDLRAEAQQDAILNGALILLVLGVTLVGAFVVARSMVRSLRRLQDTAQEVAQKRLPELVKQLSESDPQDVDTSVESVGVHSRDEIGKVATAFDDVHREAVRLAAEQALLRGNVNAMFTNLSRRSQGLIQRQLSLISELESREADPDQLSSLFKLDHLATRMRRNGENLLVLAGEEPGRRWTRPVPLVDVLRAAASEVEQYERIELSSVPTNEVAGRVVNDLVHLLAELLENATSFSSPQTKVKVTGHALPDGRVLVEIHDTGIGLSPEDLAAINERLASPPTVDVSVSRRMGLFVVGRLSLRHGIRIQLRPSDSGGTTALVMLPVDVAQGGRKPGVPTPGNAGQGGPGGPGAPGGGSAGMLGSLPSRRQVPGSGSRAALPGSGLPSRPVGAGAGASGSAPSGPSFFEGGNRPSNQRNAPAGPPGDFAGRPPLPSRGDARTDGRGEGPTVAPPTGAPMRADSPGDQGGRPQLPTRGAAPELPAPQQPGTSWGARRSGEDDWPTTRESMDAPRGHEENDTTGPFARPQLGQAPSMFEPRRGPGDTGEFALPGQSDGGGRDPLAGRGPGDTGQFARPELGQGPGDTGEYALPGRADNGGRDPLAGRGPGDTGQFARPELGQGPGDTGEYAQPRFGEPAGQGGRGPGDTAEFARPDFNAPRPEADTGSYRQGGPGVGRDQNSGTGEFPLPPGPGGGGAAEPGMLPPAGPGDGRTPIFDTIESDWFRSQDDGTLGGGRRLTTEPPGSGRPASAVPPAPRREPRPTPRSTGEGPGVGTGPGTNVSGTNVSGSNGPSTNGSGLGTNGSGPGTNGFGAGANGSGPASNWRTSPNDERWRRAEQLREGPAAGGVTSSGLPRRVPRANLVEGAAQQQQSRPSGPQVSRAPDDVRGRLTNLRRGIQQGRRAGTGLDGNHDRGVGPTYQQER